MTAPPSVRLSPPVHVVEATEVWDTWLEDLPRDVYHLAGYHRYAAGSGEGEPYLIVVGDRRRGLAWPYLLRAVPGTGVTDVGSVYGYPGPLAWGPRDDEFLSAAWAEVVDVWRAQGAVSAFTRFNPLLDNASFAATWDNRRAGVEGVVVPHGHTVSVDCTLDDAAARALYHRKLRQQIAASLRAGLVTTIDHEWAHLGDFVRLYRESMDRLGASSSYYVEESDVRRLRDALGDRLHLMIGSVDGEIAAAALNTEFNGIVQAHLIGINSQLRSLSPQKVLTDELRRWGHHAGASVLHLGGGLGGAEDSLFALKKRFSDRRHPFFTGRWVLDPDAYQDMSPGASVTSSDLRTGFFPAYRAPAREVSDA